MGINLKLEVKIIEKRGIFDTTKEFISCFNKAQLYGIRIYDYRNNLLGEFVGKKKGEEIMPFLLKNLMNIIKRYIQIGNIYYIGGDFLHYPSPDNGYISANVKIYNKEYPEFLWMTSTSREYETLIRNPDAQKELFLTLEKMVKNLDPGVIILGSPDDDIVAWFEYHKNPYMFCTDNVLESEYLEEIKQILPRGELIELIEKHSDGVIKGEEGIGVIRDNPGSYDAYICPRYFIRKELRRRGIKLKTGRTEEMIIEGLRLRPRIMKDVGFIDEEFYKKIEATKKKVKESVREKILSTGKYDNDLIEKHDEAEREFNEFWKRTEKQREEHEKERRLRDVCEYYTGELKTECEKYKREWRKYECDDYLDELNKEYEKELEKVILGMLPEDMLRDLGFEQGEQTNTKNEVGRNHG